jgi:hypothetical protein
MSTIFLQMSFKPSKHVFSVVDLTLIDNMYYKNFDL